MRRNTPFLLALAATAVLIAGCAAEAGPPSSSTPTPSAEAAPSATPTPEATAQLVVTIEGIDFVDGDETQTASFKDAAALRSLLEAATGELPEPSEIEDPPGYESDTVRYDWDGLTLFMDPAGTAPARITVMSAAVAGIPIASEEGLTIGSTRDDVVAAQGWDVLDADGDGIADYLGVGGMEVPGTTSLVRPGETGVQYLMFDVAGDVVTRIDAPADDFSDL